GFATQQHQAWERGGRSSAKKLLYVLRTALTGVHVLREGEIVTDVTRLLDRYGLGEATALVEQKRRGEKTELPARLREAWEGKVAGVFALLDRALADSPLPEESPNGSTLEQWLIGARLRWFRS
ncbi:MAG TPA: nucleotidyltransferase domain-containing protein, partial [Myxococcaceae bacterium]|nr:nucleotidyltransferase domain-containing protein [Myxococcaceae bacterium]